MNEKMPRTPFSTGLSGSAKEVEMRLKNIFSGPKKRPPVLFLALVFSLCVFCGDLVSCNVAQPENAPVRLDGSVSGDVSLSDYTARAVPIDPDCPPQTEEEEWLLQALFTDADMLRPFQDPKAHLMNFIQKDGYILGTAFVEDHPENTMILGVMDMETHELAGSVFRRDLHAGVLNTVTFQNDQGEYRLLYSFNGQENGQETGEAGLVRLDGEFVSWEWPVVGDAGLANDPPVGPKGVFQDYQDHWDSHLARISSVGPEAKIFVPNDELVWGEDDENQPKWRYDHSVYWGPDGGDASGGTTQPDPAEPETLHGTIGSTKLHWDIDDSWAWADGSDEEWEKEQEARQIAEYQSVGVTMSGKDYYYQGQLVDIFLDQRPNKSVYTLNRDPAGTVNIKILRDRDGTITGAAYMTDEEAAQLREDME